MAAGEERRDAPEASRPDPSTVPLRGAALAAGLLEDTCGRGSGDPLMLGVVRALTRGLRAEIEGLSGLADRGTATAEGALRAADVANLAASALPELTGESAGEAAASAHMAAGAARALHALIGTMESQSDHAPNDARGVAWRARLAARQVDEFLEEEG